MVAGMMLGGVLGALTGQPIGVLLGGLLGAVAGHYFEKETLKSG